MISSTLYQRAYQYVSDQVLLIFSPHQNLIILLEFVVDQVKDLILLYRDGQGPLGANNPNRKGFERRNVELKNIIKEQI